MPNRILKIKNGNIPIDFNWNSEESKLSFVPPPLKKLPAEPSATQLANIHLVDEALRDGLHGIPYHPPVNEIIKYIDIANKLGIKDMTIGICTNNSALNQKTTKLLKKMQDEYPQISPTILSLANEESINQAAKWAQVNPKLKVIIFMGSAPSRLLAENWDKKFILKKLAKAVKQAVQKHHIYVIGATEHTTQTPPSFLKEIIKVQVGNGAKTFCIADTIGIARPKGAYRLVKFVKKILNQDGHHQVLVDWHGHDDIGQAIPSTLAAVSAGVDRVHLVPWGIGERSGNTSLERFIVFASQVISEAKIPLPWNTVFLSKLLKIYAHLTQNNIPTYGCLAKRSNYTTLGIHSAAIAKLNELSILAQKQEEDEIAKRLKTMLKTLYTAVNHSFFGRKQFKIGINHWSGIHTVNLWAKNKGFFQITDIKIKKTLAKARKLERELTDEEILAIFKKEDVASQENKKYINGFHSRLTTQKDFLISNPLDVNAIVNYVCQGHCAIFHGGVYAFFAVNPSGLQEIAHAKKRNMLEKPPVSAISWKNLVKLIDVSKLSNGFTSKQKLLDFLKDCHENIPSVIVYPVIFKKAAELIKNSLNSQWIDKLIWSKGKNKTMAIDTLAIPSVKRIVQEIQKRNFKVVFLTSANFPGQPTIDNAQEVKKHFPNIPILQDQFFETMFANQKKMQKFSHKQTPWTSYTTIDVTNIAKGLIEITRLGSLSLSTIASIFNKHFPKKKISFKIEKNAELSKIDLANFSSDQKNLSAIKKDDITIFMSKLTKILTKKPGFNSNLEQLQIFFQQIQDTYNY